MTFSNLSWKAGIHGQVIGTAVKSGYQIVGIVPITLQRASTTVMCFQANPSGNIYMTTSSQYDESDVTETIGILWMRNN